MTYTTIREILDYGPFIRRIILPMPETVSEGDVAVDTFNIHSVRRFADSGVTAHDITGWDGASSEESRGYCPVEDAYVSDAAGRRISSGSFVTLVPAVHRFVSGVAMAGAHNVRVFCDLTVTQIREISTADNSITGLVYRGLRKTVNPQLDGWLERRCDGGNIPLNYGFFTPATGKSRHPLIIWLHGAGEGGTDVQVAYSGNKVVALSSAETQKLFGGAYVLAPQAPTMWMDDGSGEYGRSGKTMYREALKFLIDEFLEIHGDIDRDRIYIGGCSNGGFMTMRMVIDYPEFFAAAFPVCEALYDETISEGDLNVIKNTPLWFTHAKNDILVPPEETTVATYRRLLAAGASNIHFSCFDSVADNYKLFSDPEGKPLDFLGHFSWVPMLNGECDFDYDGSPVIADGKEVDLFEWLSLQRLGGQVEG